MGSICCKKSDDIRAKVINTDAMVDILILCGTPMDIYCDAMRPENINGSVDQYRHHIYRIGINKLMETINRYVASRVDKDRYIRMEINACEYITVTHIAECVYRFNNAGYVVDVIHNDSVVFVDMRRRSI